MSDRHEKWVRVEPGGRVGAPQPYRVEFEDSRAGRCAIEYARTQHGFDVTGTDGREYFVDSSWRPPLNLPETPTWGIAVLKNGARALGLWRFAESRNVLDSDNGGWAAWAVLDFIPLTDEQVKRIESAR